MIYFNVKSSNRGNKWFKPSKEVWIYNQDERQQTIVMSNRDKTISNEEKKRPKNASKKELKTAIEERNRNWSDWCLYEA